MIRFIEMIVRFLKNNCFVFGLIIGFFINAIIIHLNFKYEINWNAVGAIATCIAAIIALYVYYLTTERDRKLSTIKEYSLIREKYDNVCKMKEFNYEIIKEYLIEMERFSTGLNNDLYDIDILIEMSGNRLVKQYDSCLKDYIDMKRKKSTHPDTIYCEYENVIRKIRNKVEK